MRGSPRTSSSLTRRRVPSPPQVGAGAERRVEGEVARLELGHRDAADGAAVLLGEGLDRARLGVEHLDEPFGELERRLDRVGEAAAIVGAHDEAIDDDRDGVVLPAVQLRRIGDLDERAVDVGANEALLAHGLEQLAELTLAPLHERRADLDLRVGLPAEHRLGDLRRALPLHRAAAVGAVRRAGARVEQAQVVVDLRDGADGGARIVAGGLLLDRDRGREPLDGVDVGLLHQARGTDARTRRATRRSAAVLRRRSCRRRARTCPSPTAP